MSSNAPSSNAPSSNAPSSNAPNPDAANPDAAGAREVRDRQSEVATDRPVTVVAAEVLADALGTVWRYMRPAALEPERDEEYVHQLRVATRRAESVMRLLDHLLPGAPSRRIRKDLTRARRAAADARDFDVLIPTVAAKTGLVDDATLERILNRAVLQRAGAQRSIKMAYRRLKRRKFRRRAGRLAEKIVWSDDASEPSFRQMARKSLQAISERFYRAAAADLHSIENLHRLRKRGKHLRYALELLADAMDQPTYESTISVAKRLQQLLGSLNDRATAAAWFVECQTCGTTAEMAADLEQLIAVQQSGIERDRDRFLHWWSNDRAEALERSVDRIVEST